MHIQNQENRETSVARHVACMADLVGPEHVGISLDYDPPIEVDKNGVVGNGIEAVLADNPDYWPPEAGYDRPIDFLELTRLPDVCEALIKTGFVDDEIINILGGNFRRAAEQVWR